MTSIFVKEGLLSFLFKNDADNSYQLEDKSFIVFEMDEIKDNKLLLSIMLHMISEAIQKVVWSDKDTRGVVFFDEFAKMLKFPEVLSSAEYFFQAGRKQKRIHRDCASITRSITKE
jgi:conjugal transfer ATP-binding protein TraC